MSGGGFRSNVSVDLTMQSVLTQLGTLRTDTSGSFTGQITIPATATLGAHTLRATGRADGGTRVLTAAITVVANGSGGGGGGLPKTGSALPIASAALGSLLLLVGSGLDKWSEMRRMWGQRPARQPARTSMRLGPTTTLAQRDNGELRVGTRRVAPGGHVALSAGGFLKDTPVEICLSRAGSGRHVLGRTWTFANGSFLLDARMPDLRPGAYVVEALGRAPNGSERVIAATIVVAD